MIFPGLAKKLSQVRPGADQLSTGDDNVPAGILALIQALEALPVSIAFHPLNCKESPGGRQAGESQSRTRNPRPDC